MTIMTCKNLYVENSYCSMQPSLRKLHYQEILDMIRFCKQTVNIELKIKL